MNSISLSTNTTRLKAAATHNGMARARQARKGEGSRSEVRGVQNFEPGTSNFGSNCSLFSHSYIDSIARLSYSTRISTPQEGQTMATPSIKEEARRLVDRLPESSTWEDLMHEIYVRQAIETGLADSKAGRTTDVEHVRSSFGLPK